MASVAMLLPELIATQLSVLTALGQPVLSGDRAATTPAANQEIAEEVFLSVDAVKGHLRVF